MNNLRQALSALLSHPGYFVTALLTLALGIGFSTATFSVVNAVLLRPLPFEEPHELLRLRERFLPRFPQFSVSPGHYLAWREHQTALDGIAAWGFNEVNLDDGSGEPERVRVDRVSANLFDLLGVEPVVGRRFVEADDEAGAPEVVMLSYGAWQRRFGGRPDITALTIRIDRRVVPIAGVMPEHFTFGSVETEMWRPMALSAAERRNFGSHYLSAIARMKPGVTIEQARADLEQVSRKVWEINPDSKGWEILSDPMHAFLVRDVRQALLVLLGAVALVLLIACVNVANLLLARGASRQKELAIRAAVGASRARLVWQLLLEQIVLAVLSAAAGVLVAAWLLRGLLALLPDALPRQQDIGLDAQVLAFAVALAALTPILFGLLPAVQSSRPDLRELMAQGGRQGGAVAGRRLRRALVVVEVALAMTLLAGAALLIRSFDSLANQAPGFDPLRAVVGGVTPPEARYPEGAPREQFFSALLERAAALPQVVAVGISQSVPMMSEFITSFTIEGRTVEPGRAPLTHFYGVSAGYFEAMGIRVVRGRGISDRDRQGSPRVVVINQAMADQHFPNEDPIGRRIRVNQGRDSNEWKEVVGIAADVKQNGLGGEQTVQVYESYLQHPYLTGYLVVARTTTDDPGALVPELRRVVRSIDPDLPFSRVRTLESVVDASIRPQRLSTVLMALFSGAAMLLAAIGLYGVLAYMVGQRRQEIAIRVAHGATRAHIMRLVIGDGLTMAAIGVAVGLGGAIVLRRLVSQMLFGISADDPTTYVVVAVLLGTVTVVASAIPAWRATRVDTLSALRG